MKYHKHEIKKNKDSEVYGGYFYYIYRDNKYIACAFSLNNAKEFIDTFDGKKYDYSILC